jgi:hypothetical protein
MQYFCCESRLIGQIRSLVPEYALGKTYVFKENLFKDQ